MESVPAVRLRFTLGQAQMYVSDVLRLVAPWAQPPATLETNEQLKRWAQYLTEDSDESSEGIGGTAGLVGEGFAQEPDNVWRLLMKKPKYNPITNEPDDLIPLRDRYFLYIDILGFADLVLNAPERVADLYETISSLNVHRHESFGTIVFSDTILVYPKFEPGIGRHADAYFITFLCEFAEDLMHRLKNKDIYFRAILTQGKFAHYFIDSIPCFYGPALVDAYKSEKQIKAVGLFMDRRCTSHSHTFRTRPFNDRFDFVYLWQSLEEFGPDGFNPFPYPDASAFEQMDLQWGLAKDVLMLSNIARKRSNADPNISMKHSNTWELIRCRYPKILDGLEEANFNPSVFCPKLDWAESVKRAREID